MKVFFNPNCSKCQSLESYLNSKNIKFEKVLYLSVPPTKKDIQEILDKGISLSDLIRKSEKEYPLTKNKTKEEIIEILIKHPNLIQRPIVITEDKAMIARDEETINKIK